MGNTLLYFVPQKKYREDAEKTMSHYVPVLDTPEMQRVRENQKNFSTVSCFLVFLVFFNPMINESHVHGANIFLYFFFLSFWRLCVLYVSMFSVKYYPLYLKDLGFVSVMFFTVLLTFSFTANTVVLIAKMCNMKASKAVLSTQLLARGHFQPTNTSHSSFIIKILYLVISQWDKRSFANFAL